MIQYVIWEDLRDIAGQQVVDHIWSPLFSIGRCRDYRCLDVGAVLILNEYCRLFFVSWFAVHVDLIVTLDIEDKVAVVLVVEMESRWTGWIKLVTVGAGE